MNRSNPAITLLFWFMFALGGLSLALGLVLPPWNEFRLAREQLVAVEKRREVLVRDLTALDRRIDHLQHDPAYLERVVVREFGLESKEAPEGVSVRLTEPTSQPLEIATAPQSPEQRAVAIIEEATQTHPFVRMYVLAETRPYVMGMSATLLAAAVILLGRNTVRGPDSLGETADPSNEME